MKDYRTLIIEDEKPAARLLSRKLNSLGIQAIEMLHSVEQARNWFMENQAPDLIFLDIQLSDGLSFEIFDGLEINSAIIFTTAYDEFAIRAFKLNSIDYLLKPIAEEELEIAIGKFERLRKVLPSIDLQQIKKLIIPDKNQYKTRFSIKVGNSIKLIPIEEIECFFSENKGTYAYCDNNSQYLLDQTLEQIETVLDPDKFFRISRGNIVNINSIQNISVHSSSRLRVQLNNFPSQELIVSRERVGDFKEWLE
ncbi:LytTR family DNA-binding domain-containing protein [Sphingobacterium sp.]|uniref:LytR/AlgR family response regulator transcription factor n=1 Tax=Sphingobacterium sp. TaxID=341027 RepID=UPI0028ACCDF1|nr:LytTR family DNA-binding domain-containing protein [Sphingobacterium sp.]